jgi:hypothetical protein
MALDVAEMLRARNVAHHRHMRDGGAVEMQKQRQRDARHDADLDAEEERAEDRRGHGREVDLGIGPDPADGLEIDEREHRDDDRRRERRLREIGEPAG